MHYMEGYGMLSLTIEFDAVDHGIAGKLRDEVSDSFDESGVPVCEESGLSGISPVFEFDLNGRGFRCEVGPPLRLTAREEQDGLVMTHVAERRVVGIPTLATREAEDGEIPTSESVKRRAQQAPDDGIDQGIEDFFDSHRMGTPVFRLLASRGKNSDPGRFWWGHRGLGPAEIRISRPPRGGGGATDGKRDPSGTEKVVLAWRPLGSC